MAGILAVSEEIDRLEREKRNLKAQVTKLQVVLAELVHDVEELVAHSGGVYGLHLNGDPAPWSDLLSGGRYGQWLEQLEKAKIVLSDSLAEYPIERSDRI